MTVIDPATPLGKVRLRIGDFGDLPFLPDAVITQTLTDKGNNVNQASQLCASYILAMLAFKNHKKIDKLEIWSGEQFTNYLQFLKLLIANPNFSGVAPVPYVASTTTDTNPLEQIALDWKAGYGPGAVVLPDWVNVSRPVIIYDNPT